MKLRYYTLSILVSLILTVHASYAQEMIDEDFLDIIEANAKPLWPEGGAAFSATAIPEKYRNESAVILGFRRNVSIDKKSRNGFLSKGERSLIFYETVRFRIKLNDRNSVNGFTGVYFRYNDRTDGFSARVIKADGSEYPVSLNDAVSVESISSVPEFYKSFFDQQNGANRQYYKVAIPDLEPGDILEYVTTTKSKLDVMGQGYIEFSPQYELCNKNYPIMYNQIGIETDDKSFFKSSSVNGAPEFKREPASDPAFFKYVFTDTDRPVEKDVNFISSYKVYPMTKFQVIYANNDKVKGALIGAKGELKQSFTITELAKKAWEDYAQVGDYYYQGSYKIQNVVDQLWAELKKQGARDWTEKDFIKNVYYRVRNLVVYRDSYLSDKVAAYIFGSLLYQRDIKSDLIITVSNNIGRLENVLFDQEIRYAVRLNKEFYFNFTDYSNPGDLVEDLVGNEAYIIREPSKDGKQEITKIELPGADHSMNTADYNIAVQVLPGMNTLKVTRVNTFRGISKNRNISSALKFTPYIVEDYKHYNGTSPLADLSGAQYNNYMQSVNALKEEYAIAKKKFVKEELENEFSQKVKYLNFKINSDGRSVKNKDLVFTEDFEINGMLRKAGKKYLVNIPGLMGSQLQIRKEEQERKHDINVGSERSLSWTISFKIPEGYIAEGLAELNTKVDNEIGFFSCEASEENGSVVLKLKKIYKAANSGHDKWNKMIDFVTMAYNTSFRYLLLKPIN